MLYTLMKITVLIRSLYSYKATHCLVISQVSDRMMLLVDEGLRLVLAL